MYENVKLNRNNEAKTFIHKQNRTTNYIIALLPLPFKKKKRKKKKRKGDCYIDKLSLIIHVYIVFFIRDTFLHNLEPLRSKLALDDQKTSAVSWAIGSSMISQSSKTSTFVSPRWQQTLRKFCRWCTWKPLCWSQGHSWDLEAENPKWMG